jgi:glycosyltransferase involved in cell wall biosynthesis
MTGSLNPTKGHDILLHAIGILPERIKKQIVLDVYGDGIIEYKLRLRKLVKNYELENIVSFKGFNSSIHSVLKNYDIGIMASRSEGFGRTTVEYMMSGLTVIASDTGANPELIKHRDTGFLFEYPNEHALASIIEYLVENREVIELTGQKARRDALDRFTLKECAERVYSIYERMIDKL